MTTLADFRTRIKSELGIAGSSAERGFTDVDLDAHVGRVVEEFSLVAPVETTATPTVTGGTRTFNLSALTRPIRVVAVEYPTGQWPRLLVDFDLFGGVVTLDVGPPAANYTPKVYYEQKHLVDGSGSTVEEEHEGIVVVGACAYALLARAAGAAQTFETAATQPQSYQHLRLGQEWHRRHQAMLGDLQRARPRMRQMYSPSTGPARKNVVDWPT